MRNTPKFGCGAGSGSNGPRPNGRCALLPGGGGFGRVAGAGRDCPGDQIGGCGGTRGAETAPPLPGCRAAGTGHGATKAPVPLPASDLSAQRLASCTRSIAFSHASRPPASSSAAVLRWPCCTSLSHTHAWREMYRRFAHACEHNACARTITKTKRKNAI